MNRKLKKRSSLNTKQKPKCIEVKYHQNQAQDLAMNNHVAGNYPMANSKLMINNYQNQNTENLKTNLPVPSSSRNRQQTITTKFEREFFANQLKKYGSDNLENIDYLPPVANKTQCKSEVMTTMSQPVTFLNNNRNQYPSRFKSTTSNHPKRINFDNQITNYNLSNSYSNNFNNFNNFSNQKVQSTGNRKMKTASLSKSYLPVQRPLLVCGPRLEENINDTDSIENDMQNSHYAKEPLYERIPCTKYSTSSETQRTIIEQDSDDDNCYDNLDDNLSNCLANLQNTNRVFLPIKNYNNLNKNLNKHDNLIELRNSTSPVINSSNLHNFNLNRNSPNLTNQFNLTNFSIRSNNSNKSNRSNNSSNSKKSNHPINSPLLSTFNEANDLIERGNFSRSTTSNKASDDVFLENSNSFNLNENLDRKRNEQLNLILNRNENGQINLDMVSSSE